LKSALPTNKRFWIATLAVIAIVVAVWIFIDWRMQPPVPPPLPPETNGAGKSD
jgi:hypothetical protein